MNRGIARRTVFESDADRPGLDWTSRLEMTPVIAATPKWDSRKRVAVSEAGAA
jgi:hypothetical protein